MRIPISLIVFPFIFACSGSNGMQKGNFKISGRAERIGAYCGGARPTQEILEKIKEPKPVVNTKFYVRKDTFNDVSQPVLLEFTTDSSGNFGISLPPGKYCIVNDQKKDKAYTEDLKKKYAVATEWYEAADAACLEEWLRTPDAVLIVNGDVKDFVITWYDRCSWYLPCVNYTGPLPP
ncbi:MAG: hypothetical protein AB1458_14175 [Bacteroidota bacterium]